MNVYLDHAATTPILPAAAEAYLQAAGQVGNPSSLHSSGRTARRVVEESREKIAGVINCRPGEIIFTSGGTEADNMAIKGLFWSRRAANPQRNRVLVSAVEHHAVIDPADWLGEHEDAVVQTIAVDALGRIRLDHLHELLSAHGPEIAVISVMMANNEVGTIQPIAEVIELAHEHGVPVHVDAVQGYGHLPLDFAALDVDALTITAHKMGGPHGVGALVARRGLVMEPLSHGGGQERKVRSGTLNAPAIAAFGVASEYVAKTLPEESARVAALRDDLIQAVQQAAPFAILRGDADPAGRLPGNALFTFPGCEGDSMLYLFDANGVECSTGSACQAGVPQPSHVLTAMGIEGPDARCAVRFSLGHTSTSADVDRVREVLPEVLSRAIRPGAIGPGSVNVTSAISEVTSNEVAS